MTHKIQFRLRLYQGDTIAIGPGRVALLEAVAAEGSISAAARRLGMSYRRAWMLLEALNGALAAPATQAVTGGARGGGTRLTAEGEKLIRHYRAIEALAQLAAADELAALTAMLAPAGSTAP